MLKLADRLQIAGFSLRTIVTLREKYPSYTPQLSLAENLKPRLPLKQRIYDVLEATSEEPSPLIQVLLTKDVPGLGVAGSLVKIHRNRFWRYLYPACKAELPTDERIDYFAQQNKLRSQSKILCGDSYRMEKRLANMTLYIPMNPASDWTLNKTHVKVAFRKYGITVPESCLTLPAAADVNRQNATEPFKVIVNLRSLNQAWWRTLLSKYRNVSSSTKPSSHRGRRFDHPSLIRRVNDASSMQFCLSDLTPANLAALSHFDQYYNQLYGPIEWQAMRLALLCPPTKAALVNNSLLSQLPVTEKQRLIDSSNIVDLIGTLSSMRERQKVFLEEETSRSVEGGGEVQSNELFSDSIDSSEPSSSGEEGSNRHFVLRKWTGHSLDDPSNLSEFTPSTDLVSEHDLVTRDIDLDVAIPLGNREAASGNIHVVEHETISELPQPLRVSCARPGRLHSFGRPRYIDDQATFYPLDLASVIVVLILNLSPGDRLLDMCAAPGGKSITALQTGRLDLASVFVVLILNLSPGDRLLDMCAAPGGKSITALQTGRLERLVCVDNSTSRLERLRQVIDSFTTDQLTTDIDILRSSQLTQSSDCFSKILVDVPCSTDRHALTSPHSNLFSRGKLKARMTLHNQQLALLKLGLDMCQVGGSLIYSTCTLSHAQNHCLVESVVASSTTNQYALVDLSPWVDLLRKASPRLGLRLWPIGASDGSTKVTGLLVIPSLASGNYGPVFVAKIRRLT